MQVKIDKLIKEKRKTINLKVDSDGLLIVKAPTHISDGQINEIIKKRADWIREKQDIIKKLIEESIRHYVLGEKFLFMGSMIEVKADDEMPHLFYFNGECFFIKSKHEDKLKSCLEQFYIAISKQVIVPKVYSIAKDINISINKVRITNAETRWGSCSARKNININRKLIMAPEIVLNYVIIHELCHIIHMNHSKDFWGMVEQIMPDYKIHKKWLKENGHTLNY